MGSLYRNKKSYVFSYYKNGNQIYKYLNITNTISDTRKNQLKRQLENRYEKQNLNSKYSPKLESVRDDYIELKTKEVDRKQRSINTLIGDKQHLRCFCDYVKNNIGLLNIIDVNRKVIESFMNYRFDVDNCNSTTVGNNIRCLQGFFKYCVENDYIDISPITDVKIPKPLKRTSDQIPNKQEFETIKEHLIKYVDDYLNDKDEYNWIKLISYIQVRIGMRLSEVLTMKWKQNKNTDFGENHSFSYVYLNSTKSKLTIYSKKRLRIIPIKNHIKDVLNKIQKDTKSKVFVFENPETESDFNVTSFSRPFKKFLREIKIDDSYSSHTLRHGKITELIRNDFSINKIGHLVGHSNSRITELYSHLLSSDIDDLIYN